MPATHRRILWWHWLVAAIVLFAAAQVAWQLRPLTAMERRFLGTWDIHNDFFDGFVTFADDRRFTFLFRSRSPAAGTDIPDIAGSWSAADPWLQYTYDSPTKDLWAYWKREWALFSSGMSRTTSISLTPVEAKGEGDEASYRSTDPSVSVTLKPVSAIDRARLGLERPSLRQEPAQP